MSITDDGLGSPSRPADGQVAMARANAAQRQRPLQNIKDITVRPAEGRPRLRPHSRPRHRQASP